MVRQRPSSCIGCPCYSHGSDFSQIEGSGSFGIMFVAEASGEMEARDELPLRSYAPAGSVFERTLRRLGYSRDQFTVTNVLRCRPRENWLEGAPWEYEAIQHCQSNLLAAIRKHKPKVIIALGGIPFRSLTGISGKQRGVSHMRGYVFRALPEYCDAAGNPDLLVLPTYHPSFLRRGAIHLTGVFARDIQRAVNIRAGKDKSYILDMPLMQAAEDIEDPFNSPEEQHSAGQAQASISAWMRQHNLNYILHPTLQQLDSFCRDVKQRSDAWLALSPDMQRNDLTALSWDLETRESADLDEDASDGFTDTYIKQIQFSIAARSGLAFPWQDDYIQAARWLLKLPLPKLGQNNWLFDDRVVLAVGKRDYANREYFRPAGRSYDIMQMFHYWQPDLPAHLQAAASFVQFEFAWKHLGDTNLPFYGAVDVDAPIRIWHMLAKTMRERGIWEDVQQGRNAAGYVNMVEAVRPILAAMEDRGFPVDNERRLALDAEFSQAEQEARAELDCKFPEEARKLDPKQGYKGIPPRVKLLLKEGLAEEDVYSRQFQDPPGKNDDGTPDPGDFFYFKQRTFQLPIVGLDGEPTTEPVQRWCKVYEFSPNSPKQLKQYMDVKRHKVPKKKSGEDTTGKIELQRMAARYHDDFYLKVVECREIGKMRGTYIDGFKPQQDGLVHTTFTFATSTGQLTSRNPVNFQNVPKHGRLAKPIRSMFRCADGKLIVEWDKKSYHVMTTGFESKCPEYMRLARLDMHSFVAGHFNKDWDAFKIISETDEELKARFKWFKADPVRKLIRDKKAKPCIAEGELVLTDKGLVPIQDIKLYHKLWDGVEWVSHNGVIYQGVKKVIIYDGLKATECHPVVSANGDYISFGEAASGLVKLESTGSKEQAVRTSHRDKLKAQARERILAREREMLEMWNKEINRSLQSRKQSNGWLSVLLSEEVTTSESVGQALRCDYSSMLRANQSILQGLWRSGNNLQVQFAERICTVCDPRTASQELQGGGDRQSEQRWALRAGQFATSDSQRTTRKSTKHSMDYVQGDSSAGISISESLWPESDSFSSSRRNDWRRDYRERETNGRESKNELQDDSGTVEYARVYDIVDAGPRKCYTVSQKLVGNCILGIGFGLGVKKLYDMNRESFRDQKEAQYFRDILQQLFAPVFVWQNQIRELAHRQQYLRNRFGMIRWFFEVYVPDRHGGWAAGEQSEQAIAFLPASDAFGDIREIMKELARRGLDKKWSQCNTVHDSLLYLVAPDKLEEHCREMYPVLSAPSKVLIDADVAPQGLVVDIECSAGENWAEMKEVDLKGFGL